MRKRPATHVSHPRLGRTQADYPVDYFIAVLGRIVMGGFFLWSGIDSAINLAGTTTALTPVVGPQALGLAVVVVLIESLGGLALITGYFMRTAALVLVFFIIITASALTNFSDQTQMAIFFRNMAIVGGLLYMASAAPKIA